MSNFAQADTTTQSFVKAFPGKKIQPQRGCLHTTETRSWPGYKKGRSAPHYTARPVISKQKLVWRAHFPDERSSRALQNLDGGVETNTFHLINVELIGTCDPVNLPHWKNLPGKVAGEDYVFWPDAPEWALDGVAAFLADMKKRHGIPLQGMDRWTAFPKSFGFKAKGRMTPAQWREFVGWCGHQHVPENDHGDPGNLDIATLLRLARGHSTGSPMSLLGNLPVTSPKDEIDMASINDLKQAIRDVVDTPEFKKGVARFVIQGFPFPGHDGTDRVLQGHLTQLESLAALDLRRDSEQLAQILGASLTAKDVEDALRTVLARREGGSPPVNP